MCRDVLFMVYGEGLVGYVSNSVVVRLCPKVVLFLDHFFAQFLLKKIAIISGE